MSEACTTHCKGNGQVKDEPGLAALGLAAKQQHAVVHQASEELFRGWQCHQQSDASRSLAVAAGTYRAHSYVWLPRRGPPAMAPAQCHAAVPPVMIRDQARLSVRSAATSATSCESVQNSLEDGLF